MAIVAPVNQGNKTSASTGSLAVTTLANIAQGDLIVVFHNSAQTAGTMGSIVDPAASTYSQGAQQATNPNCAIYYAIAAAAIASGSTITVNFNGGATNRHGVVIWSGAAAGGTWALDVNAGTSTGTATASGTLTFPAQAQAIELLVAMIGADATAPGAVTWDQGFTQLGNTGSVDFVIPAYLISAAASGNTVAPSWVNSILYRTIAVSFQLTPAANTNTVPTGGGNPDAYKRKEKPWRIKLPDGRFLTGFGSKAYQQTLADLRVAAEIEELNALAVAKRARVNGVSEFKSKVTKRLAKKRGGTVLNVPGLYVPKAIPIITPAEPDDDDEEEIEMILRAL